MQLICSASPIIKRITSWYASQEHCREEKKTSKIRTSHSIEPSKSNGRGKKKPATATATSTTTLSVTQVFGVEQKVLFIFHPIPQHNCSHLTGMFNLFNTIMALRITFFHPMDTSTFSQMTIDTNSTQFRCFFHFFNCTQICSIQPVVFHFV